MVDIVEIYVHWYAGRSKSQVATSLGVDRKTIRKYLAPAEAAGMTPGGPPMSEADWAKLIKSWFPELASRRLNQLTWPEIEQHRDYIKQLLETTTVTTIHQRLRDERKLKASLTSLRRWVHENLPEEAARSKVTVLREEVEPGSEAQIDYGFLGQWINPRTGKRHRIWAFVMVLPCSRHMFVRPVTHMDQHAWTLAHVDAFRYFGGYVGDNSSATSCSRPGWSLPSRSSDGLAAPVGTTRRRRGEPCGIARARPGRRLLGVRGGTLSAEHVAGHRLRPEGLLLGGAQGAGRHRPCGRLRVHHRSEEAAARPEGRPARRR
ncbi:hypothetical protein JIX56_46990 [Streptomyces sp. CA-210063]|uniref:hypothetical protein n=1 Tax=Streptomyces sp. CA-210063 TaxID=2801029 RepID=UPI00214CE847|nr:hypothetical protein [Streptomyces sp. CA-210063]UUU36751.1 hypothetical protein JIX56_46990 [Streptomyces sp. CA-210063]